MTQAGKNMLIATFALALLIAFGFWGLVSLLKKPAPTQSVKRMVVASHELSAYESLTDADLKIAGKSEGQATNVNSAPAPDSSLIDKFKGRYLLASVKKDQEITEDLVAPSSLTSTLSRSFVTAIQATSVTTIGGKLHTGDKVDLVFVPAKTNGQAAPVSYEDVLVVDVPVTSAGKLPDDAVIVLAIPQDKRDNFASTTPGATLLLTKKIKAAQ